VLPDWLARHGLRGARQRHLLRAAPAQAAAAPHAAPPQDRAGGEEDARRQNLQSKMAVQTCSPL